MKTMVYMTNIRSKKHEHGLSMPISFSISSSFKTSVQIPQDTVYTLTPTIAVSRRPVTGAWLLSSGTCQLPLSRLRPLRSILKPYTLYNLCRATSVGSQEFGCSRGVVPRRLIFHGQCLGRG